MPLVGGTGQAAPVTQGWLLLSPGRQSWFSCGARSGLLMGWMLPWLLTC